MKTTSTTLPSAVDLLKQLSAIDLETRLADIEAEAAQIKLLLRSVRARDRRKPENRKGADHAK